MVRCCKFLPLCWSLSDLLDISSMIILTTLRALPCVYEFYYIQTLLLNVTDAPWWWKSTAPTQEYVRARREFKKRKEHYCLVITNMRKDMRNFTLKIEEFMNGKK